MLRQRILTACVLLALVTATLLASSPSPFVLLMSLACALAGWEWLRMTAQPKWAAWGAGLLGAVLLGIWLLFMLLEPPPMLVQLLPAWVLSSGESLIVIILWLLANAGGWMLLGTLTIICWIVIAPFMVLRARVDKPARSLTLSLFAVLTLLIAGFVLALMAHAASVWFVVSLLVLVWVADIAAYFVGRKWGRRKLAAQVSPGKSIEGALAGMVAGVVWVLASSQIDGSFGERLLHNIGLIGTLFCAALLVAASITGDLFESLIKRRAGCKDSSQLLPGHGGVWDRIDAILPVAPLACFMTG